MTLAFLMKKGKRHGHDMEIAKFKDYDKLSAYAVSTVIDKIIRKGDLLLCAATGSSPLGLYSGMSSVYNESPEIFKSLRVIKLDEWVGVPVESEASCEGYLRKHLIQPLNISSERYYSFNAMAGEPDLECQRMNKTLTQNGPIDVCILGLGKNGHLGFNEPGESLISHCHSIILSEASRNHNMVRDIVPRPTHGITLGMEDILSSRRILLIISGVGKDDAKRTFYSQKVTSWCPATYLWEHDNVECLILED